MIYPWVVEYGVQSYPHEDMKDWRFMRIEYHDPEEDYAILECHVWMPPGIGSLELEDFMSKALEAEDETE